MTLTLLSLTALSLGLFAGSLLTEAVVLVPYWRSLEPEAFLDHYRAIGPRLYQYFSPLTVLATLIPTITAAFCTWESGEVVTYPSLASLLVLTTFGMIFVYFKSANASFASRSVGVSQLPAELRRWGTWHWTRTVLAMAAFLSATIAIAQS